MTGSSHTNGIINVCATLPTKRDGIINTIPALPMQAKKLSTVLRKLNVMVTTFVVHSGWEMRFS